MVQPYLKFSDGRRTLLGSPRHNQVMYEWATPVTQLLLNARDGLSYHIGGMYIEFDNSGSPVTPPVIARQDGTSYYAALSAPRDYVRVPIALKGLESSDEVTFPDGNVGSYWGETQGAVGVNGLTFSSGAGSRVYGGALVVFRDTDDSALDLIFSRFYFTSGGQIVKPSGVQIGIKWSLTAG
jgi:hypothetical protein